MTLDCYGLPRDAFEELLGYFAPIYLAHSPFGGIDGFCKEINTKIGRPRDLNAAGYLGLALAWTRTRGALWHLAVNFGLTSSTAHDWLLFSKLCLIDVLRLHPSGAVKIPSGPETEEYK